jgi:non-canonical (house-cleaning) NTP pyrophosphatase
VQCVRKTVEEDSQSCCSQQRVGKIVECHSPRFQLQVKVAETCPKGANKGATVESTAKTSEVDKRQMEPAIASDVVGGSLAE